MSFLAALLRGDRAILGLLRQNPFADRPPSFVRARLYRYRFTSWQELARPAAGGTASRSGTTSAGPPARGRMNALDAVVVGGGPNGLRGRDRARAGRSSGHAPRTGGGRGWRHPLGRAHAPGLHPRRVQRDPSLRQDLAVLRRPGPRPAWPALGGAAVQRRPPARRRDGGAGRARCRRDRGATRSRRRRVPEDIRAAGSLVARAAARHPRAVPRSAVAASNRAPGALRLDGDPIDNPARAPVPGRPGSCPRRRGGRTRSCR